MSSVDGPVRLCLFSGLLLIMLAFWKGDGGYVDLREYLDDAERLALKGDMRLPGNPDAPPRYNRYSIGLPVLAAPIVWVGAGIQWLTNGAIHRRTVAAFIVPLMSAFFGVLLYNLARALNYAPRIAFLSALIASLGSPHLTYSRMFFAESAIELGILLSVYAFVVARQRHSNFWLLVSGAGLAIAGASHYPHGWLVGWVWIVFAIQLWISPTTPNRFPALAIFTLIPFFSAVVIAALNFWRFGQLVPLGYQKDTGLMGLIYVPNNLRYLSRMLLRTPWFLPGLITGALAFWRGRKPLISSEKFMSLAMCGGVIFQVCFWLAYFILYMFPTRYLHPISVLAALGLPALLTEIRGALPKRGLACVTAALLLSNALQFFGDTLFQPFLLDPTGEKILAYVWYMAPAPHGWKFQGGTPAGAIQYAALLTLLGCGTALLVIASSRAKDHRHVLNPLAR